MMVLLVCGSVPTVGAPGAPNRPAFEAHARDLIGRGFHLTYLYNGSCTGNREFSPTERQFRGTLEGLAKTFGIAHRRVDGNDIEATVVAAELLGWRDRVGALEPGLDPRVRELAGEQLHRRQ